MDLKNSHFQFTAVVKNDQKIQLEALELFPSMDEVAFQSRVFSTYAECVKSCKGMMEDISVDVNRSSDQKNFKVGAEVNPLHTGTETFSKDWEGQEVARFWVYDKSMEGSGTISAVCKGSIFAIPQTSLNTFH